MNCDPTSSLTELNCDICVSDNGQELIVDVVNKRRTLPGLTQATMWLLPDDRETCPNIGD